MRPHTKLLAFILFSLCSAAGARTFTDNNGHQTEAELIGVRGSNVVLYRQGTVGQWPINQLSEGDKTYVREWLQKRGSTTKLSVRIFERDGIGEKGTFPEAETGSPVIPVPPPLPGVPGVQVQEKTNYKHYDVDISNPGPLEADQLKVDYVLYVIKPDGTVAAQSGSQKLATLGAGQRSTVKTEGISFTSTKTKSLTLKINANRLGGNLTTGQKTARSSERFGGAWVRVRSVDGTLLAEARSLQPELEKMDPPWVGPKEDEVEEIPVLKALGELVEMLKNVPKPPGAPELPPKP